LIGSAAGLPARDSAWLRATSGPAAAHGDGIRANPLREAVQG